MPLIVTEYAAPVSSVVTESDGILSRAALARVTFLRMSSAFLVQMKPWFRKRSKQRTHYSHRQLSPGLSREQRRSLRFETLEERRMFNGDDLSPVKGQLATTMLLSM